MFMRLIHGLVCRCGLLFLLRRHTLFIVLLVASQWVCLWLLPTAAITFLLQSEHIDMCISVNYVPKGGIAGHDFFLI